MVMDKIQNASLYYGLGPRFQQALEWLQAVDPDTLTPGERVELDGTNVYAFLFEGDTLPAQEGKLECHRNYIDIQYLASGLETVGYALSDAPMEQLTEYDAAGDIQFFTTRWDTLTVRAGTFYIVWPHDLHAPRLAAGDPAPVRRLVAKIKLD